MHLVIANTRSGNGAYRQAEKQLTNLLSRLGNRFKTVTVRDLNEIAQVLATELSPRTRLLIALGGDSTAGEIIDCLPRRQIPLLLVPIGTSNALAQSLGIDSAQGALRALKEQTIRHFRLGKIGERFFLGSVQIAPRKNLLRQSLKRPRAIHQLLNALGLTEENQLEAVATHLTLDHHIKLRGEVVSIMVQLENQREEKRGLIIQIIARNKKGEITESVLKGSGLTVKAETNLPIVFGHDIVATTPATIQALARSLPMLVGKKFEA